MLLSSNASRTLWVSPLPPHPPQAKEKNEVIGGC